MKIRRLRLVESGPEPCATNPEDGFTAAKSSSLSGGAASARPQQDASGPVTPTDLIDQELENIDRLLTRMERIVAKLRTR